MNKKIKHLKDRSIETIRNEGVKEFAKKTKNYIYLRAKKQKFFGAKDILFINGCTLPHPSRYRVEHQIEQLESSGLSADRIFYENLDINTIKYYRAFVFFRCPVTDTVKEFIKIAKSCNKKVFFDIDDLVFDTKYTNSIKYIKTMSKEDKKIYDDGVKRMGKTLELCDYAITTTEPLAKELKKYVKEVYINRNVASERMVELSIKATKNNKKSDKKIVMGYLSGSITHNPDFELILPTVEKLMSEYNDLYLQIGGLLDIPDSLKKYKNRIITTDFVDWEELPTVISGLDINLAPIEESLFNDAKSENKWTEASLCKVVTVASTFGAFKKCIKNNKTGLLCKTEDDWYKNLKKVIEDKEYREKLATNAFNEVIKSKVTTYSGRGLAQFINNKLNKNIAFVLPTTNISGGVNVIIKHCFILRKHGYDVSIINMDNSGDDITNKEGTIGVINSHKTEILSYFDTMVASLWTTLKFVREYPYVLNKSYLVQNYETNFADYGAFMKREANSTYNMLIPINYLTISKWCQNWLKDDFEKDSIYAPNGIELKRFKYKKRNFTGKIKLLVEGNSNDYYKNVDESFKIIDKLDKNKYEIHFLSYQGEPKKGYYVDKFYHKVPYDEVGKIYQNADILIKSSILESFSYPPLEMMATGGLVVVAPNGGNVEYLKDGENCLFYELGNIEDAKEKIERLCEDKNLRDKLIKNGLETAESRKWSNIEKEVLKLYEK